MITDVPAVSPMSSSCCHRYTERRAERQMIERAVTGGRVIVRLDTEGQVWEPSDLCPCCRRPRHATVREHTIQTWHPSDNTTITWAPYQTRASAKDLSWVPVDLNVSYLIKSIKLEVNDDRLSLYMHVIPKHISTTFLITWLNRWHE